MLHEVLTPEVIALDVEAKDWREAVRRSGDLLYKAGKIEKEYIDDMIQMVEELGPYIVIIPGIALAHARPDTGKIKELGVSLVRLKEAVCFGHEKHDPVKIVMGFAANSEDSHLDILQELTCILQEEESREILFTGTLQDIISLIKRIRGSD